MKIIEERKLGGYELCACGTKVLVEEGDLNWSHTEEDHYYVKCPRCGRNIWFKGNMFYDEMWNRQFKSKNNN